MSDWLSSVLKSAEPASTRPATLGRSAVMKNCDKKLEGGWRGGEEGLKGLEGW